MISIIIPTLNEEECVGGCIEGILAGEADCEVIIVDGGSTDRTVERAAGYGVTVVHSERGRGRQMNRGALSARGDILLFLHADTRLEEGWSRQIQEAVRRPLFAGGAFTFKIDSHEKKWRLIELWVKARCALFNLPYGDQGIFVCRGTFEKTGGYVEIPLMEDVEFIERLKESGRIVVVPKRASTSGRRWKRRGWIRVSLLNQVIMILYRLGVDPERLAGLYYAK
jgi:rSAM/selenodomain-associated transferase 2